MREDTRVNRDRSASRVRRFRTVVVGGAVAGSVGLAAVLGVQAGAATSTAGTDTSSTSSDSATTAKNTSSGSTGLVSPSSSGSDSSNATTAGS